MFASKNNGDRKEQRTEQYEFAMLFFAQGREERGGCLVSRGRSKQDLSSLTHSLVTTSCCASLSLAISRFCLLARRLLVVVSASLRFQHCSEKPLLGAGA